MSNFTDTGPKSDRLPRKLSDFTTEHFALLKYVAQKNSAVLILGSRGESQKLVFELNQMRKSLNFWSPDHELTDIANKFMFIKDENQVRIRPRNESLSRAVTDLPGFKAIVEETIKDLPEAAQDILQKVREAQEATVISPATQLAREHHVPEASDYLNKLFSPPDPSEDDKEDNKEN